MLRNGSGRNAHSASCSAAGRRGPGGNLPAVRSILRCYMIVGETSELTPAPANEIGMFVDGSLNEL